MYVKQSNYSQDKEEWPSFLESYQQVLLHAATPFAICSNSPTNSSGVQSWPPEIRQPGCRFFAALLACPRHAGTPIPKRNIAPTKTTSVEDALNAAPIRGSRIT
jgi:hypothetical protein